MITSVKVPGMTGIEVVDTTFVDGQEFRFAAHYYNKEQVDKDVQNEIDRAMGRAIREYKSTI